MAFNDIKISKPSNKGLLLLNDPAGVMQDVADILLEAVTIRESGQSQLGFLHEVGEMARDADRS